MQVFIKTYAQQQKTQVLNKTNAPQPTTQVLNKTNAQQPKAQVLHASPQNAILVAVDFNDVIKEQNFGHRSRCLRALWRTVHVIQNCK